MREHDSEPVAGLPEELPEGERILWQGSPDWLSVAVRVFHLRVVGIYFLLLLTWFAASLVSQGASAHDAWIAVAGAAPFALAALALLTLFAYLVGRTSRYTITTKRVVMRFGVALPISMNIPFNQIVSADLKEYADRTGDIALNLVGEQRQSFVLLWPHVRPWRTVKPEPMLRCAPNAREVAALLSHAVSANARDGVRTIRGNLEVQPSQPVAAPTGAAAAA